MVEFNKVGVAQRIDESVHVTARCSGLGLSFSSRIVGLSASAELLCQLVDSFRKLVKV